MGHFSAVSIAILIPALLAGEGCQDQNKNPMGMKFSDTYGPNQQVITDPKNIPPVAAGKSPLVYQASYACKVRVLDATTKKLLATSDALSGQFILVDTAGGIRLGDVVLKQGPLDPAARYEIYLDTK